MKKAIVVVLVLFAIAMMLCGCNSTDYKEAVSLYKAGKYEEALELFNMLGDYKDSKSQAEAAKTEIQYLNAINLSEAGEYEEALELFNTLGDYKDSVEKAKKVEEKVTELFYESLVGNYPCAGLRADGYNSMGYHSLADIYDTEFELDPPEKESYIRIAFINSELKTTMVLDNMELKGTLSELERKDDTIEFHYDLTSKKGLSNDSISLTYYRDVKTFCWSYKQGPLAATAFFTKTES